MILALSLALAQDHAPGEALSDAITVNITRDGLDQLGGVVGGFLPTDPIVIDPVDLHGGTSFCLFRYELGVRNISIDVDVTSVEVIPSNGMLDVALGVDVTVNTSSNPFIIDFEAACIGGDCDGNVATFPVALSVPIALAIVPGPTGQNVLDATIGSVDLVNGLTDDDIQISGCVLDTVQTVLDFFGFSLYEYLIGIANDFLTDEIGNQVAAIETTIEDAFSQATIDETFEILPGVALQVALEPATLVITPEGMSLGLDGSVAADLNECVAFIDPGGSRATAGLPPAVGGEPAGTHVGVHVTDDFVNQAMYAVWRSGVLCQALEGEVGGFALDTNLLGLLGGDPFRELFPETKPILLQTVPLVPLEAEFGGISQIDIPVRDVDIRIFSELDGRQARVLSVAISPDVGIDLAFDGTTGNLAANIELGDDYAPRISGDMVVKGADEDVLNTFGGVLGGIIDSVAGGLLSDAIAFDIPSLDGFGLSSLVVTSTTDEGLTALAMVGTVPYSSAAGCAGGQSCAGGGCSSTGGASYAFLGVMVLLLRRREHGA